MLSAPFAAEAKLAFDPDMRVVNQEDLPNQVYVVEVVNRSIVEI